jgi:hypothetical protein
MRFVRRSCACPRPSQADYLLLARLYPDISYELQSKCAYFVVAKADEVTNIKYLNHEGHKEHEEKKNLCVLCALRGSTSYDKLSQPNIR